MKIGITCYPTYGGSGVVATELGWNWHSAVTKFISSLTRNPSGSGANSRIFTITKSKCRATHYSTIRPTTWPWPHAWRGLAVV